MPVGSDATFAGRSSEDAQMTWSTEYAGDRRDPPVPLACFFGIAVRDTPSDVAGKLVSSWNAQHSNLPDYSASQPGAGATVRFNTPSGVTVETMTFGLLDPVLTSSRAMGGTGISVAG